MFEGIDGLQSKVFMWNDETGTVTNTYVWDSESAARAFFTPELKAKVIELLRRRASGAVRRGVGPDRQ